MATLRAAAQSLWQQQQRSVFPPSNSRQRFNRLAMAARCSSTNAASGDGSTPPVIKVAAIAGSFRRASTNDGLIRAAIELSKDIPGLEIEQLKIDHLPFVNTDLEIDGRFPDDVEEFRSKVLKADSFLFACPEYNYSMPGVLKNAIDWASRAPNCWADKPAALMSAGGGMGGARSQYHFRQTAVFLDLHILNKPELFVRSFEPPTKFDADGNLVHLDTRDRIKALLLALQNWTLRLKEE